MCVGVCVCVCVGVGVCVCVCEGVCEGVRVWVRVEAGVRGTREKGGRERERGKQRNPKRGYIEYASI